MQRPPRFDQPRQMEGEFPSEPEPIPNTVAMEQDIVVRFGPNYVNIGGIINSNQVTEPFDVQWSANMNSLYTLMLIDNDMPYPNSNQHSPYLLTLITNIPGNDYQDGDIVMPYQVPALYANSTLHRLTLLIFQQTRPIAVNKLGTNYQNRANFNVDQYQQSNGLELDYSFNFYVAPAHEPVIDINNMAIEPEVPAAVARPTGVFAQRYSSTGSSCGCHGKGKTVQNYANPRSSYSTAANPTGVNVVNKYQNPRIRPDSELDEQDQKYCSCVIQVEAKEGDRYNPYAVCHSSVRGVGRPDCGDNYDWPKLTDAELIGYAEGRHDIAIPQPYNRSQMLNNIREWKRKLGKQVNF